MPGEFKEVNRLETSDSSAIVLSELRDGKELKGWVLNKWITSEKYTGFVKGGIMIPEEQLTDFLRLFPQDELKNALN